MPGFMVGDKRPLVIVRGAGDISTGTIHRLFMAGFPVIALEMEFPSAIRRKVAFSEAVYDGKAVVEGVTAVRADDVNAALDILDSGKIPVLVDPEGRSIGKLRPSVAVDAVLAKRNLGTRIDMAPLTIGLGPGFEAGRDVHYVIETMRGHDLGRIIKEGCALPDTGVPGMVGGYAAERVIHAQAAGIFRMQRDIGSIVEAGEVIGTIVTGRGIAGELSAGTCSVQEHAEQKTAVQEAEAEEAAVQEAVAGEAAAQVPVTSLISGVLRGVIRDRYPVTKGFKLADVDPRLTEQKNCYTISDKARCIGGSVLELVCRAI